MKNENEAKTQYIPLEMEIIRFDAEDVITTSGGGNDDDLPPMPFG